MAASGPAAAGTKYTGLTSEEARQGRRTQATMNELRGTLGIGNIPSVSDGGKKGGVEGM